MYRNVMTVSANELTGQKNQLALGKLIQERTPSIIYPQVPTSKRALSKNRKTAPSQRIEELVTGGYGENLDGDFRRFNHQSTGIGYWLILCQCSGEILARLQLATGHSERLPREVSKGEVHGLKKTYPIKRLAYPPRPSRLLRGEGMIEDDD